MYALIIESNSGQTYVYSTFKSREEAEKYRAEYIPERGLKSWKVVTHLPPLRS